MPDVPPDVAIKATIRPGSVYYFQHESFSSSYAHYFIVINIDPLNEQIILLVCASSQIAAVRKRSFDCPPATLVQIMPNQYPDFTYPSIVDCNYIYQDSLEKLVERLSAKQLQIKAEMNMSLVKQLRRGVLASRLIPGRIKMRLQPAN